MDQLPDGIRRNTAEIAGVHVAACRLRAQLEAGTPRAPKMRVGSPDLWSGPSDVITRSALSLSACSRTNSAMCGLPISSSPSSRKITLQGSSPWTARCGFKRQELREVLTLVVANASRVNAAVADRRLERRAIPKLERVRGLYVVMAIEQDRRLVRRHVAPAEHHRMVPSARLQPPCQARSACPRACRRPRESRHFGRLCWDGAHSPSRAQHTTRGWPRYGRTVSGNRIGDRHLRSSRYV